jgi:hypothetical protein
MWSGDFLVNLLVALPPAPPTSSDCAARRATTRHGVETHNTQPDNKQRAAACRRARAETTSNRVSDLLRNDAVLQVLATTA